jgi:hypothetical protein
MTTPSINIAGAVSNPASLAGPGGQAMVAANGGTMSNNNQLNLGNVSGNVSISLGGAPAQAALAPRMVLIDVAARTPAATIRAGASYRLVVAPAGGVANPTLTADVAMRFQLRFYDQERDVPLDDFEVLAPWPDALTPELVQAGGLKAQLELEMPDSFPQGVGSLRLEVVERGMAGFPEAGLLFEPVPIVAARIDSLKLEGTYVQLDRSLQQSLHVRLDNPPPEGAAIMHVRPALAGRVNLSCYTRSGRLSLEDRPLGELPALDGLDAGGFIAAASKFSASGPAELLKWLRDFRALHAERLGLLVCDHTEVGAPWEALELADRVYLGSVGGVARWMPVRQVGAEGDREVAIVDEPRAGRVLALGPPPSAALAGFMVDQAPDGAALWDALFAAPESYAIVYIGGLDMAAGADLKLEEELLSRRQGSQLAPAARRPLFLLDAPRAAIVSYQAQQARGLAATLLGRVADGLFGFAGGAPAATARLSADLLAELGAGLSVAEALRRARAAAFARWQQGQADDAELVAGLLFRYYGNPLIRLQLTPAAGQGGQ